VNWSRWRRSRPFAAGLLTTAAGIELILVVLGAPGLLSFSGASAPASWILGALLIVAGLTMWLDPVRRYFAGAAALACALLSLVQSNLGGFLLGFGFAAVGGSLALAWTAPTSATPSATVPANEHTPASSTEPPETRPAPGSAHLRNRNSNTSYRHSK
jgi:hypothetical protein